MSIIERLRAVNDCQLYPDLSYYELHFHDWHKGETQLKTNLHLSNEISRNMVREQVDREHPHLSQFFPPKKEQSSRYNAEDR